jgi:F-type H+-transporting ATPase subunit b
MLIDWFTVLAQMVNFLVLVWLLRRFLYGPILGAIDAREKDIAARLAAAEATQAEARKERDDFQHKAEAFDQQRDALLHKATDEADAARDRLTASAQKDADAARTQWQASLQSEQHALGEDLVRHARQGVFDIARKTLAELAATPLEACMGDVFIARLRSLSGAAHDQLAASLTASAEPALVRSAFDLAPAQRAAIQAAVGETYGVQTPLRFETAPSLISGIELTANGQKVAWNIADSLEALERDVSSLLDAKAAPMNPRG